MAVTESFPSRETQAGTALGDKTAAPSVGSASQLDLFVAREDIVK